MRFAAVVVAMWGCSSSHDARCTTGARVVLADRRRPAAGRSPTPTIAHLTFTTMALVSSTIYDIRSSAVALEVAQMVDVSTTQTFELVVKSNSVVVVFEQTAKPPVAMRWWRIKADATSISWEVSPDDDAWTQLAEVMQIDGLDQVDVSIGAAGNATSPSEAQIDNVGSM